MDHVSEAIPAKSDAAPEASRQLQLLGAAMVVVSTASIAIVPTLARLAYDGGTNTMTVITARSVFSAAVCFLAVVILGRKLRIPRRALTISLGLGVLYAIHLYSLLAAVTYLPVNMVVLIYFLHPLMIGIAVVVIGQQKPSLARLGALAGAIVGLGLAVGFSLESLNIVGMVLAFVAAVIAAVVITCSSIAMRDADSFVVVYYMMLAAAIVLVPVSLVQGGMALPVTSIGWVGFAGVAIAYTIGTLTFFGAIPLLGAVRAAMITNLEPVLGILFAVLILGERISPLQGVGIVMVVAAIFVMEMKR
ncbi:MAG TPA: DMT family transporter [Verrucomicrobiae bacterium]|nr:DMT family transporter [Verrucomicrobiae bacterium]